MALSSWFQHNYCSYLYTELNRLEANGYGLKHSIANLMNQPSCTLDATTVLKYNSQGRALLLLVSTQNLKPSSWHIWRNKNHWKQIRNEKVMAPQSKGGQKNSRKQYWGRFLNTQKVHFMFFFVIKVPMWLIGLQMALL